MADYDFHEEEAVEKPFDARLMARLLGYLKPYERWVLLTFGLILIGSIVRQERLRDVNSMLGYPDDADAFEKFREDPHALAKFHSMAEALRRALCRASNKAVLNLFP